MNIIEINSLKKYYGHHLGVEDVSFSVKKGEIFGFVGPNGAGKSTTLRVLLNFIFPSEGNAKIMGMDVVKMSRQIKEFTSYVPSEVRLYEDMRIKDIIKVNDCFYKGVYKEESERLCKLFELDSSKRFSELSLGNKKKVSIVCALSTKPRVLILDEPTSGLDPMMQLKLFAELKEQVREGVTVLLSSHNLGEVEEHCDRVAFIKEGKILSVTDLKNIVPRKIVSIWGGDVLSYRGIELIEETLDKKVYLYQGESTLLLDLIKNAKARDFTIENEGLEDRFITLYKDQEGEQ